MFTRIWLFLILVGVIVPASGQVDTSATEVAANPVDDTTMATPPPVSGEAYSVDFTSEARSNYLLGGLSFTTAYSDNVLAGFSTARVSDVSYSIWPSIALDKTTPRLHSVLRYSPGFTFYQRNDSRNQANQDVTADFTYRLSPHVTLNLSDSFLRTSSLFNQSNPLSVTTVSGSVQTPTIAVVAPLADLLSNRGNAELTYQFGRDSLIGARGTFTNLHYSDSSQVSGLADSNSQEGSAFYSHRLARKHYIGVNYQYARILSYPTGGQSEAQTHAILVFYTVYLKPSLSVSLSGGPQHTDVTQPLLPPEKSWSPAAGVSLAWQGRHTSLAAGYSRQVSGGGGLIGAFHSDTANGSARWQFARSWSAGLSAGYSIYKSVTPFSFLVNPGGHTVTGGASVQHKIGQHLNVEAGYSRLYQSYGNIAAVKANPDTNREFITLSYQFSRPLGR